MDKCQFQCVRAVHAEVDSLLLDGWKIRSKYCSGEQGLCYYLVHDIRGMLTVSTNAIRTQLQIRKNGQLVKCQSFGV